MLRRSKEKRSSRPSDTRIFREEKDGLGRSIRNTKDHSDGLEYTYLAEKWHYRYRYARLRIHAIT